MIVSQDKEMTPKQSHVARASDTHARQGQVCRLLWVRSLPSLIVGLGLKVSNSTIAALGLTCEPI